MHTENVGGGSEIFQKFRGLTFQKSRGARVLLKSCHV